MLDRQREREQALRERKAPVYIELMKFYFRVVARSKSDGNDTGPKDDEIEDFLKNQMPEIIIWASDDVVRNFSRFRQGPSEFEEDDENIYAMRSFEELIRAIRQDVGHKSTGISRLDLLSVFINDIHKELKNRGYDSNLNPVVTQECGKGASSGSIT